MAYREFYNARPFVAPDLQIGPRELTALAAVQQYRANRQLAEQHMANNYRSFVADTTIPTHNQKINQEAIDAGRYAYSSLRNTGLIDPAVKQRLMTLQSLNAESKAQAAQLKELDTQITARQNDDPYYKPNYDRDRVMSLLQGNNLPVEQDIQQTGQKIQDLKNTLGNDILKSFDAGKAVSDYVNAHKEKQYETEVTTPSGIKTKKLVSRIFFDDQGSPGVTDSHVVDMFRKDKRFAQYYDEIANQQLVNEIRENKARDPNWMAGKSDVEILSELRHNPDLNPNPKAWITEGNTRRPLEFNERARDLAKKDMASYEKVQLSNAYDAKNRTPEGDLGFTNDKVAHAYTFHENDFAGPGGVIPLKTGRSFSMPSTSANRLDLNTGEVTHDMRGKRDFSVEGYQLVPVGKDDTPINITAKSPQQMIQDIQALPDSAFDPNKKNAITGIKIALRGTTTDKAKVLQAAFQQEKSLNQQIADANIAGDANKVATLTQQRDQINKIRQLAGLDELTPDQKDQYQALLPYLGFDVEHNELVVADQQDTNRIKAITGGFDINNQKNWSPEMKVVNQAIQQRIQQAAGNNYGRETPAQTIQRKTQAKEDMIKKVQAASGIPKVSDPEEFNKKWNALRSGDRLIGPDGKVYTKK